MMYNTQWPNDTPITRLALLLKQLEDSLSSIPIPEESKNIINETRSIVDGFDPYLETMSSKAPSILGPMIQETNATDWEALHTQGKTVHSLHANMCAGGYEAVVLQMFAKMTGARRVLEIGMFTGTTTVSLALLPHVERVVTMDIEAYLVEHNLKWWKQAGVSDKIETRIGDAKAGLQKLKEDKEQFDLCFIDANKDGYAAYFKSIIDLGLLAPKGIVVLDNTLYKSSTYAPHKKWAAPARSIDEVNRLVVGDSRVETVMLPVRDGVTIARIKD